MVSCYYIGSEGVVAFDVVLVFTYCIHHISWSAIWSFFSRTLCFSSNLHRCILRFDKIVVIRLFDALNGVAYYVDGVCGGGRLEFGGCGMVLTGSSVTYDA